MLPEKTIAQLRRIKQVGYLPYHHEIIAAFDQFLAEAETRIRLEGQVNERLDQLQSYFTYLYSILIAIGFISFTGNTIDAFHNSQQVNRFQLILDIFIGLLPVTLLPSTANLTLHIYIKYIQRKLDGLETSTALIARAESVLKAEREKRIILPNDIRLGLQQILNHYKVEALIEK
jgi:hypothetical protein